jgi:hypothetical protein
VEEVVVATPRPRAALGAAHMAAGEAAGEVVHNDTEEVADIPDTQGTHTQVEGTLAALGDTQAAPREVEPAEAADDSKQVVPKVPVVPQLWRKGSSPLPIGFVEQSSVPWHRVSVSLRLEGSA